MNWLVFFVIAWLFAGLEVGFADALQVGHNAAAPSFVMILLTFIALWTTTGHVMAAALVLGLMLDLFHVVPVPGGETIVILGPHALGCLLGAYAARTMRGVMFQRGALAIGFLSFVATMVAIIVTTACLTLRGMYEPLDIGPASGRLFAGLGSAVLTGLVGVPVGWLLSPSRKLLGFPQSGRAAFRMP